jgi:hypothetical protein
MDRMESESNFCIDKSLSIIAEELKRLNENGIIRTKNLVGDLGEYYACKYMKLGQVANSVQSGYDAIDNENLRVQIKARRMPESQNKISFSSLEFDYCIFVEIDEYFKPIIFRKASKDKIIENLERTRQRLNVSVYRNISSIINI